MNNITDYKIIIEKDQTKKGRYQLQLYINNNKSNKPFTTGINNFAEIVIYAIKLKEVIEEERKIKLPYSTIGFKGNILKYKKVDKTLKTFIEKFNKDQSNEEVIPIDKVKKITKI